MFPGGDGLPQGGAGPSWSITAGRLALMTEEPRVAVITGGASGIGLATARLLAEQGWRLVLADVEAPRLDAACAELGASDQVAGVVTDVGVKESVDALAAASFERFGRVDVVFNNAGVAVGGLTVDMSHADWAWLMQVNLWGPIHGVEAFLPRLVEQEAEAICSSRRLLPAWPLMCGWGRTASPSTAWWRWPRFCTASCEPTGSASLCCAPCGWQPTSTGPRAIAPPSSAASERSLPSR